MAFSLQSDFLCHLNYYCGVAWYFEGIIFALKISKKAACNPYVL